MEICVVVYATLKRGEIGVLVSLIVLPVVLEGRLDGDKSTTQNWILAKRRSGTSTTGHCIKRSGKLFLDLERKDLILQGY